MSVKRMFVTMFAVSALIFSLSAQEVLITSSIKDFWDKVAANPRGHFVLTEDIDATGFDYSPPYYYQDPFLGTLDGKGKTIYNLRIIDPSNNGWVGLLGYVGKGGTVKNLGVIADSINGAFAVGILAGGSDGTISGCYTKGKVAARRASSSNVGGLAGVNGGVIRESYSTASVSGASNVGGLVGMQTVNIAGAGIYDSYTSGGTVTASGANAGGLVGYVFGGAINYSLAASGEVRAVPAASAGGLIGYDYGSANTDWKNAGKTGIGTTAQSVEMAHNFWNSETTKRTATAGKVGDATAAPITNTLMGMTNTYRNWIGRGGVWSFTSEGPRLNNVAVEYTGDGIQKISLSSAAVNVNPPSFTYNGNEQTPALTVIVNGNTLVEGVDYQILSAKNDKGQTGAAAKTNIGVCTLTILGIGGYTGMKTAVYSITEPVDTRVSLATASITPQPSSFVHNGNEQTPALTVIVNGNTLVEGVDYQISSAKNDKGQTGAAAKTNVGICTLTISGIGNYKESKTVVYSIIEQVVNNETDLTKMTVVFDPPSLTYNGNEQTPTLKANGTTLVENTDYTIIGDNRGSDNGTTMSTGTNVGLVTFLINGIGDYKGLISVSYNITQASIQNVSDMLSVSATIDRVNVNIDNVDLPEGVLLEFALRKAGETSNLSWGATHDFIGLTPNTEYRVYYRAAQTRNYAPIGPDSLTVETGKITVAERDSVWYTEKEVDAIAGETVTLTVNAASTKNTVSFSYTWYATQVAVPITALAQAVQGGTTASIQVSAYQSGWHYFAVVSETFTNDGGGEETRELAWAANGVITVNIVTPAPPGSQAEAASAPGARLRGRTLLITASKSAPMTVRLIDMRGRTAARFKASADRVFALPRVPTGRYVMEVRSGRRVVERSSVVLR